MSHGQYNITQQPLNGERGEGEEEITPSAPDAAAELEGQVAVALQQLRADLAERDAADADILGGRVAGRVVALEEARRPEGIAGGQGRDDGVARGEVGGGARGAQEAGEEGGAQEAHGHLCRCTSRYCYVVKTRAILGTTTGWIGQVERDARNWRMERQQSAKEGQVGHFGLSSGATPVPPRRPTDGPVVSLYTNMVLRIRAWVILVRSKLTVILECFFFAHSQFHMVRPGARLWPSTRPHEVNDTAPSTCYAVYHSIPTSRLGLASGLYN